MNLPVSRPEEATQVMNWLHKISAIAALIVGSLLVAGALDLTLRAFWPTHVTGWLTPFQSNWLLVIFKLHAGFSNVQPSLLYQVNLLDLVILGFTAILYVGLYAALRKTGKIWSLIALAQPVLGIALFLVTKTAGRCAVMGAEFVIAVVMLRGKLFSQPIASIGIVSALLLLAGDIALSLAPSSVFASAMAVGYVLLVAWLFLISRRLLRICRGRQKE